MLGQTMTVRSRLKVLLWERNFVRVKAGLPALTIRQIAEETGLATSTLTGLTANRARRVDYDTLNALCKYLECKPGDILEYVADDEDDSEAQP
jgi:putative transcriptional regulator